MPDIKTEMSKVLTAWEQDEQDTINPPKVVKKTPEGRLVFTKTNNVTEETFNYVRDNPNLMGVEILTALELRGFKKSSVGSLLTQFVKQGQMARTASGKYTTLVPAYIPLKSNKAIKAKGKIEAKQAKAKAQPPSQGIAALKPEPVGKATGVTASVATTWDADTIINNIGLKQARALYDELKKIFGG